MGTEYASWAGMQFWIAQVGSTRCFNAGQEVHRAIYWSVWLQILSIPYSLSGPTGTAGLIVRRINMFQSHSERRVSVQLLDGLSPKDASVFALVTNAAAQRTAKGVSIETGQLLRPNLGEMRFSLLLNICL